MTNFSIKILIKYIFIKNKRLLAEEKCCDMSERNLILTVQMFIAFNCIRPYFNIKKIRISKSEKTKLPVLFSNLYTDQ